jgi:trehalose 6-phosphate synthase
MFRDRNVHVGVFPIGIEPQKFIQGMEKPEVKARTTALAQQHRDKKIIIGVDRLDFTKGISPKFNALELFLGKHAE